MQSGGESFSPFFIDLLLSLSYFAPMEMIIDTVVQVCAMVAVIGTTLGLLLFIGIGLYATWRMANGD